MMTTTTMTETKPPPAPLPAPPLLSLEPPPSAAAAQREADEDRPTSSPLLALLASAAALAVANASAPAPWTPPRERRALRRVPRNKEMTPEKLVFSLALAFERSPALAEELRGEVVAFSAAGEEGRQRGARPKTQGGDRERRRCLAAALRSAAYLAAGDAEQALLDARTASARAAPPLPPALRSASSALVASALEKTGQRNSEALLEWLRCLSMTSEGNERQREASAAVERLRRRVPEAHARALRDESINPSSASAAASALAAALSRDAEERVPEVMRPKPKYYHYYKWTTKRIKAAAGGTLPAPEVLRRLLACPAGDLDDVLSHPTAAPAAIARLSLAFEKGGSEALEREEAPRLTWEEMREVQAWREGMELGEEEREGQRALEGSRGRGKLLLDDAGASGEKTTAVVSASSSPREESGSDSELDLDALDF